MRTIIERCSHESAAYVKPIITKQIARIRAISVTAQPFPDFSRTTNSDELSEKVPEFMRAGERREPTAVTPGWDAGGPRWRRKIIEIKVD